MLWNYIKIALRNLRKNKVFAAINILGLAIGMTIYVFGGVLVKYESTHDAFFANSDRIYTVGSIASPNLNVGITQVDATWTTIGPFIKTEVDDVEAVARTLTSEHLVNIGGDRIYQKLRAADPAFLKIFDLDFIHGDATALDDPTGLIMSESAAIKYFGSTDVIGKVITLDNAYDFRVNGVYADVPKNSHFNSMPVLDAGLDIVIPMAALARMDKTFDINGDWNNLSMGNMTYVLLSPGRDQQWLQTQLDGIYERHLPKSAKDTISSLYASPLQHANLGIWDTFGLPVVDIIRLLSFLVLVVACVNYTNLATAQALGRSREVGMRKTMGAQRGQLLMQFLVESVVLATIAMLLAVAIIEIIIPLFDNVSDKVMRLDYLRTLPWLVATAALVGLCAGAYPAWLITRATPIDALRDEARKGKKGSTVRSFMIGAQFAISAFMLACVAVVYMQNQKVEEASYIFPRSQIYTFERIQAEGVPERLDTLRHELEAVPGVEAAAYSSQVPYEQNNSMMYAAAKPGDEAGRFQMQMLHLSPEFLDAYNIPLLAGRNLSRDIAGDKYVYDKTETVNVLINDMVLDQLGIDSPADAINKHIYQISADDPLKEMVIVGVVPTQNIVGLFSPEKPWVYLYTPGTFRIASVRIAPGNMKDAVKAIETTWDKVIPEYPMQGKFLDDTFDQTFDILRFINMALAGFAFIALALAMIGLFGLAAFMATQRTKEIGVRKVLGASSTQIARLLVWQFSKPVAWALAVALPAAWFSSNVYLNYFADRIGSPIVILLVAGMIAVGLAWATVAGHAIRIARSNPVLALRYE
jgi:putative ABC transport system permease protein